MGTQPVPCPSCVQSSSTSQTPIGLSPSAQTPQTQAYNSYPLGNNKQTVQTVHKHMTSHHSRLSHVSSPKLEPWSRLG